MDLETAAEILYGWPKEKTREVLKERECHYCKNTLGPMEDYICAGCQAEKYRDMIDRREEMDRIFHPEDYQ